MPTNRRNRLLRVAAWFVLLFAIMPNVMYMGHGPLNADIGHADAATGSSHDHSGDPVGKTHQTETDEHALHCHQGPSKCAGAQSLTGSIWVGEDAGLLALNARLQRTPTKMVIGTMEVLSSKIVQPPRQVM